MEEGTQTSNIFNDNVFNEVVEVQYNVVEDNKVLLANASNKFDVYPITYTNCVRLNHSKTLDEFINEERKRQNNIEKSIYNQLQSEILRSEDVDTTHQEKINNINNFINNSVISSIGAGLTVGEKGSVANMGDIKQSNSIKVNTGKGLTFDNNQLALNLSNDNYLKFAPVDNSNDVVTINLDALSEALKPMLKEYFDTLYKTKD